MKFPETQGGWEKYEKNPVLGGNLGTCFDISLLYDQGKYRMWFSWRPKESIALVESQDGIHWGEPKIVLAPNPNTKWEQRLNRPIVLQHNNQYHMWYTGQNKKRSWIGYATSPDGVSWSRMSVEPVLSASERWEKKTVMCPHVLWDEKEHLFRMWYSGGDLYEPNAIGNATSKDGLHWIKLKRPIFVAEKNFAWERDRVTAAQVIFDKEWHFMFYIGFTDIDHARIGVARSKDGISNWERHKSNPIISPGEGKWDHDACYKPYAIFDGQKWLLWYNGRHGTLEQIGVAFHDGQDLGFE